MPRVRRQRVVGASREEVWEVVSDPHHLPRWWPNVQRVEEASPEGWTEVLQTGRGRPVRGDMTRTAADPPARLAWRQELVESPFERILRRADTELSLEPAPGGTLVRLTAVRKMRGLARLGGVMVRRATARQLDDALDGLERIVG
jgi:uncharacterized protein YndB with AHSA1/START domain